MNSLSSELTPPSGTGVTGMPPVPGRETGSEEDGVVYTGGAVAVGGTGCGCRLCPQAAIPTAAIDSTAKLAVRCALARCQSVIRSGGLAAVAPYPCGPLDYAAYPKPCASPRSTRCEPAGSPRRSHTQWRGAVPFR